MNEVDRVWLPVGRRWRVAGVVVAGGVLFGDGWGGGGAGEHLAAAVSGGVERGQRVHFCFYGGVFADCDAVAGGGIFDRAAVASQSA